ncbi:MAG: ferritin family protein [Chloroflexi bacterium]|nr:ferritin family protein [Chloroflexota bacterium]
MAVFFSGLEIIQVAIKIEQNGIVFYGHLAQSSKKPELRTAFEFLAGQEKLHEQVFSKMQSSAGKSYAVEQYPGEEAAYLKSLADSILFTPEKVKEMAARSDENQALDLALGFEKDAVLFYTDMMGIVRDQDKKVVDWVLGQEKAHIKRILDLKAMLASARA